jgi:glycosyltransferase involved in cell wall biosynthesis
MLYVLPAAGFGGAERQGLLHIKHLAQHGVDVVSVVGPGQLVPRALEEDGVRDVVFLPKMADEVSGSPRRWGEVVWECRATQRTLTRIARERQVDIIFASRSLGWIVASGAARRLDLPIVWRGGSRITRWAERAALRLMRTLPDLFVANCEAVAANFAPYVGRVELLLNAVDTERFAPRRETVPVARKLVGLAARPAPGKGLELLVEIVARVAREEPTTQFAIAGNFPSRPHYERMFAAFGDRVSFLGHVQDMAAFYARCDVIVLTSDEHSIEGSPNALLEAMAMERAIVATRVGGVPEIVEDGTHGLLVDAGDAPAFAHRLVHLLRDDIMRRHLGAAARSRIVARHGIDAVVGRLARLLRETSARHHTHEQGRAWA